MEKLEKQFRYLLGFFGSEDSIAISTLESTKFLSDDTSAEVSTSVDIILICSGCCIPWKIKHNISFNLFKQNALLLLLRQEEDE